MGGFGEQLAQDLPPEDLRRVLGVFQTDLERLGAALTTAAAAEDIATFRRVAHGLAGAAAAVGAQALEQACRLAMTRSDPPPGGLPGEARAIDALGRAALAELARFLATLK